MQTDLGTYVLIAAAKLLAMQGSIAHYVIAQIT